MTDNEEDIKLLRDDPHALLLKYQETIGIIVKKYIAGGMFAPGELADIIQEVNVALLLKIPAMQKQYNGKALFKTYFSVIVRNICLRAHRKEQKHVELVSEDLATGFSQNAYEGKYFVEEEVKRFRTILNLYHNQRPKLLLCLKLYYKIPLTHEDIHLWCPKCTAEDLTQMVSHFGGNYDQMSDINVYSIVTPIFNRYENKSNSVDALRKWVDSKVHEIIDVLNGKPRRANYTIETLKILVDDFFSPFLLEK